MFSLVYVSYSFVPSRTANSIHVMKMCSALSGKGVDVKLLVPKSDSELNKSELMTFYSITNDFEIVFIDTGSFDSFKRLFFIIKSFIYIFKLSCNVVYSRDLYVSMLSSISFDTYYEAHTPLKNRVKAFFLKCSLLFCRLKIVSITHALKSYLIRNLRVEEKLISVLPDGADVVVDGVEFSQYITNGKIKLGYVGNLYKGKGIEVIESLSKILPEEYELHIIGGTDKDIKYWSDRIISQNVIFHGFVPQNKLFDYISELDICLLPNQKVVLPYGTDDISMNISDFTSPLKMFEYMSYGKPIIASDLPVLREILNESNSILVPPDNIKQWLDAVHFLKNEDNRSIIGLQAYNDFQKHYSWDSRAQRLLLYIQGR